MDKDIIEGTNTPHAFKTYSTKFHPDKWNWSEEMANLVGEVFKQLKNKETDYVNGNRV